MWFAGCSKTGSTSNHGFAWLFLGLGFVALMPSSQSLWMDEGFSISYAQDSGFSSFLNRMLEDPSSEPLMPGAMFATWLGAKAFGTSELGLRAVSASWAALAIFFMWCVGQETGLKWLPVLMACHPFLWYYAGEARPYAMVIAMAAGVLFAVSPVFVKDEYAGQKLWRLAVFGPLLCASHLLAVVPFGATLVVTAWLCARSRCKVPRKSRMMLLVSSFVLMGLGLYYVWTLARGSETVWDGPWSIRFSNAVFPAYELLGFVGMGPGRHELRQAAVRGSLSEIVAAVSGWMVLGIVALAGVYLLIAYRFICQSRVASSQRTLAVYSSLMVVIVTAAIAAIISVAAAFPFWGRHVAALLPFLVYAVAMMAATGISYRNSYSIQLLPLLLSLCLLASSLVVRFSEAHYRDDYRSAAGWAANAVEDQGVVWWAASDQTTEYYGLHLCEIGAHSTAPCGLKVANLTYEDLCLLQKPDLVVLSRPDLFDTRGSIRRFLADHRFRLYREFKAFHLYTPFERVQAQMPRPTAVP